MKQYSRISFFFFTGILLLPLLQSIFKFISVKPLSGAFVEEKVFFPKWNYSNFKSGTIQESSEAYWKKHFGLKNDLIRINNQFNYSFFSLSSTAGVMGENKMFFPESYIKSYYGEDFIGQKAIYEFIKKTKIVQDSLEKKGKLFFILLSPGKALVYPENIPEKYKTLYKNDKNNYDVLIEEVSKSGVRMLDLAAYIKTNPSKFKHPIFPKNGLHWTGNTVAQVSDTLIKYIDAFSSYEMTQIDIRPGELTVENYRYTDYDIGKAMNLLWNVADDTLHYPQVSFKSNDKSKPTLLGIGDSFIQSFYGFYPIFDSVFSKESQVWYYNRTLNWPRKIKNSSIKIKWLDLSYELDKSDIIILEMTDENIKQKGYKFIDDLYSLFHEKFEISGKKQDLYDRLSKDTAIDKRAERLYTALGYSRQHMKNTLIVNQIQSLWATDFDYEAEIQKTMLQIRKNSSWLNSVKEKAIRQNIPLNEAIRKNAKWLVDKKLDQR